MRCSIRVRDHDLWTRQLVEFEIDDLSRQFRTVLLFWMAEVEKRLHPDSPDHSAILNEALKATEVEHGFLSIEWISQMMLVMVEHFDFGEELFEGLSFMERRMIEQATAIKLAELQDRAADTGVIEDTRLGVGEHLPPLDVEVVP